MFFDFEVIIAQVKSKRVRSSEVVREVLEAYD
jgi:hypothetical protein